MNSYILDQISVLDLKNFEMETLLIESAVLAKNFLKDSPRRRNPILIPKKAEGPLPVIMCLAGLTGNGPDYFSPKFGEFNTVQRLDQAVSQRKAPKAIYVFVDALTAWGGSQFINSLQGNYEDYIIHELVPAIHEHFDVSPLAKNWCVTGGSSGGYGALHLGSKFPKIFGVVAALAPDCFFEASLKPDIYNTLPEWVQYGGLKGLIKELENGTLKRGKNFHSLINAVGMALCYADGKWPIDENTGEIKNKIWQEWLEKDPIYFLPKRLNNLKKLSALYIDVGHRDQFHLYLGCRQIHQWLKSKRIRHHYSEFNGTHFDLSSRRPEVWSWLKGMWG